MARVYRVMRPTGDHPAVGDGFGMLGVRVPQDIQPDETGQVHPGPDGMSVFKSVQHLPARLVPRRLRHLVPAASGNDRD